MLGRIALALMVTLGAGAIALPTASAQGVAPNLLACEATLPKFRFDVPTPGSALVQLTVKDVSNDSPNPLLPSGDGPAPFYHTLEFLVQPVQDKPGWSVQPAPPMGMRSGDTRTFDFFLSTLPTTTDPLYGVNITVVLKSQGNRGECGVSLLGYSPGLAGFSAQSIRSATVQPKEIVDLPVRVTNMGLTPRIFTLDVASNPCGAKVVAPQATVIQPRETQELAVTISAPGDKPLYLGDACSIGILAGPQDNERGAQLVTLTIIVEGWYVNPQWIIWAVEILVLLLLIIFFIARRKARIEEEILGKPQKPWTIPVEAVYLKHLKQRDPRAFYVVRHFLMEDEYRSAMLWYKAYKGATKGSRKKERVVIRQEHAYAAWREKWQKKLAKPPKKADRFEAKLQRKIDRTQRKKHHKVVHKVDRLNKKMEAAYLAQEAKAMKKWESAAAKADKKGNPRPPKPDIPEPDYADEPGLTTVPLAEHRYAKRAARYRRRMARKQGNLEVRFEKADARRLAKVRRKVQRIARKLDDPDFVNEHPLLRADGTKEKPAAKAAKAKSA